MTIKSFITDSTTCQGGTACANQFSNDGTKQNSFVQATSGGTRRKKMRGGVTSTNPPGTVIVAPLPSGPLSNSTNTVNINTDMQQANNQGIENATGDAIVGLQSKGGSKRSNHKRYGRKQSRKSKKGKKSGKRKKGKKTRKFIRRNI